MYKLNYMETKKTNEVSAKFKLKADEIEISGSEEFVTNQLELNRSIITEFMSLIKSKYLYSSEGRDSLPTPQVNSSKLLENNNGYTDFEEVDATSDKLKDYENALFADKNKVQLLSKVPGNTGSQRIVNLVLIYLWVKHVQGIDTVNAFELKSFCADSGEKDDSHFAEYIKSKKKYFIISGSTRKWEVKATQPALKSAEGILNEINNNTK